MAITKPPVLPAWAESGDKVTPSNAEIQVGWPLSSIPPSRQRFNWLLNYLANAVRYFSRRGIPDYDAAETYMTGDRIIGDDGKTYRSLIDTNLAQTPSTSPAKWERWGFTLAEFTAAITTPPQFDNDTSLSTTEFVQRALGNYRGLVGIGGATTLTAADTGKVFSTSGGYTVTLPALNTCPMGAAFHFSCEGGPSNLIIATAGGGETFNIGNGVNPSTISLQPGESISVVSSNTAGFSWYVVNRSAEFGKMAVFASSISANGYQKLPSGLIVQWGKVNAASNVTSSITFPVAFPSACLNVQVSYDGVSSEVPRANSPSTTGFSLGFDTWGSVHPTLNKYWFAVGY